MAVFYSRLEGYEDMVDFKAETINDCFGIFYVRMLMQTKDDYTGNL